MRNEVVYYGSMSLIGLSTELRELGGDLRAALDLASDRGRVEQLVVDRAVAGVGRLAGAKSLAARDIRMNIKTMFNIKCQRCGVVMPEVHWNQWIEVRPNEFESFCWECMGKMGR